LRDFPGLRTGSTDIAVSHSHLPRRILRLGLALIAVVIVAANATSVAVAKGTTSCAKQVVADWYDDGRVGKIYPLACYTQAIKSLPIDIRDYSNAKEEIGRALAFAKLGKQDPGGTDPTPPTTGSGTGTGKTPTDTTPTGKTPTDEAPTDTSFTDETPTDTAASQADTSGPSSVPIPLLVLGGLAVLLVAAGSAGYLRRRMNNGPDDDGTPPASV
jgi:hypothetical protein